MALLSERMARDVFEPAWQDLRVAHLARQQRSRSGLTRRALELWHAVLLLALLADCWRLALAGALDARERRDRRRNRHRIPHDPKQTERFAMFLYHLRHAFRQLVREPAFTVAALLTLALGVGANVAVFAVVEGVLLRPLPYVNADDLVILNHRDKRTGITKEFIALGDYIDLAAQQSAFETLTTYGRGQTMVIGDGEPVRVDVLTSGPGLLEMLRTRPVLGRTLRPEDSRPGAAPVVLLGHELWRNQYGGDPSIIGRTLRIGQRDRQVVGVTPPGFAFPPNAGVDVVMPTTIPLQAPAQRRSGWIFAIGRLAPGRTIEDAAANLATLSRQYERDHPQSNLASEYLPVPLRTALLGNTRPALVLLFAAVAVVLLIACANVANLLLARSLARRREMSVRMALGAGYGRLAVQLLSESLALALVAGVAGTLFAYWGARSLVALLPQSNGVPALADVRINGVVLAFTLGIVIVTALVFGVIAALSVRSQGAGAGAALNAPSRASMSVAARRATSGLVVVEVALAIVLLVGAGLILRSFAGLLAVEPGFRTENVMTIEMQLPSGRYPDSAARATVYDRMFAELRAVPGVEEVGAATVVPLTGNNWTAPFERVDRPVPVGERPPEVGWQNASGGYFEALQIPLVAGRLFDERDRPGSPNVVIVSEAIQQRFFPNETAVGRQVRLGEDRFEIVGVVGSIRRAGLRDEPRADMYFPFELGPSPGTTLFIRTAGDPERTLASMQSALRRIEPLLLFGQTRTMADVASESVRVTRLIFLLLGVFAATALALAAVGIYGVMSYAVRQRTREIGTRIALGATRGSILWLVLRQGAVIAALGTAIGLAAGLATTRLLESNLYGVTPTDPATLAAAVGLLVVTIMVACWVPARRAASVDPAKTLADQ